MRTHSCGEVSETDLGSKIRIVGWTNKWRDHGGVVFIDLRDRSGVVQVVFSPEIDVEIHKAAHKIRNEFVLQVEGEVRERPEGTVNTSIPTGKVEVVARAFTVLNECKPLPFMVDDDTDASETLCLQKAHRKVRGIISCRAGQIRDIFLHCRSHPRFLSRS
jgi:aspartyl-tRNA synthetase